MILYKSTQAVFLLPLYCWWSRLRKSSEFLVALAMLLRASSFLGCTTLYKG